MRCFSRRGRSIRWHYRHLLEEVPMATQRHGQIIETPTEARQAEPGPSVLALLTVSTGLAVLILGIVWFVFFPTGGRLPGLACPMRTGCVPPFRKWPTRAT